MTKAEMSEMLNSWGVHKPFKPQRDESTDAERWELRVNRPAQIVDGALIGVCISVLSSKCFEVWTPRVRLAKALAAEHGLKIRKLDGEALVYVPASKADALLPLFGAKVKKQLNPDAAKLASERLANAQSLRKFALKKALSDGIQA